jgi:PIN domain nuclease of toxin-antitoxin system
VIVLDTHAFVWLAGAPERLTSAASSALAADDLSISTASIQEVAYLCVRGRLAMDRPVERWLRDAMRAHDVRALQPTVGAALRAGGLDPQEFHGDPIDRLIYATAVEHDAGLVSADQKLREADPGRVIW